MTWSGHIGSGIEKSFRCRTLRGLRGQVCEVVKIVAKYNKAYHSLSTKAISNLIQGAYLLIIDLSIDAWHARISIIVSSRCGLQTCISVIYRMGKKSAPIFSACISEGVNILVFQSHHKKGHFFSFQTMSYLSVRGKRLLKATFPNPFAKSELPRLTCLPDAENLRRFKQVALRSSCSS